MLLSHLIIILSSSIIGFSVLRLSFWIRLGHALVCHFATAPLGRSGACSGFQKMWPVAHVFIITKNRKMRTEIRIRHHQHRWRTDGVPSSVWRLPFLPRPCRIHIISSLVDGPSAFFQCRISMHFFINSDISSQW